MLRWFHSYCRQTARASHQIRATECPPSGRRPAGSTRTADKQPEPAIRYEARNAQRPVDAQLVPHVLPTARTSHHVRNQTAIDPDDFHPDLYTNLLHRVVSRESNHFSRKIE